VTSGGWDLLVVGAGSSGAALAVRSAEQGKRVLLLEAGQDYRSAEMHEAWRSPNPIVALMDPTAAEGMVWMGLNSSRTEKQQPAPYWRGRGVGGSSSINGQIAIRPPMEDFEEWVRLGCAGWSPEEVLPYFVKLEDDEQFGHEPYHGRGGPTPIYRTPQDQWGAVDAALARAALAAGYEWAEDVNAPGATGVSPYPINSRGGRRVSVNDAYLETARELPNLTIRGDALVDQVVFEGSRAAGVHVLAAGTATTEYADTVVLSAGVVHSPAILMRSGIGPAGQLRSLGIHVRADLPVGRGMQDHPMAMVQLPLTAAAAIKTPDDRHTNVCVRWTSGPGAPDGDLMFVSMNQSVLAMATANTGAGAGAFGVWLNQNHSRGEVTLTSADPADQPQLRQRMLSDERDLARLRAGVRKLAELARSEETATIVDGLVERENEALFAVLDSDSELGDHLLATVGDAQHGTSTCRMGDPDDAGTVVDPTCRVLGLDGLRVIDASIFPAVTRANTNLAAIMVGELMADRLDD
jgi:choline dehydrogenase